LRHPRSFALLPVALVALAGCGGTTKSSSTAAKATPPAASTTSSTPSTATSGLALTTKQSKLGAILAGGPKKLTVYLFEADKGSTSSCVGACAKLWPPVIATGQTQASGAALAADLGTTTRSDGAKQVTYKGHPLYYFAKDGDAGDAYGEALKSFGAGWYVLTPSGNKIDNS